MLMAEVGVKLHVAKLEGATQSFGDGAWVGHKTALDLR